MGEHPQLAPQLLLHHPWHMMPQGEQIPPSPGIGLSTTTTTTQLPILSPLPQDLRTFFHSARMRGHGEPRRPPCDPLADTIDSSGPSLTLPNGGCLSAVGLPPGPGRETLEKALVIQESER